MSLGLYKREDTPHKIAQTHHTQEPSLEMVTPGEYTQRSHLAMWGRGNPGGNAPGIDEVGGTGNGKATWKRESTNKILFSANCSLLHLHTAMQLTLWARKQQHDTVTTYIHTCVHMLDTVTVTYDVVTTQDTVTAVTSVHTHSTWAASRARPWGQTLWDH